MVVRARTRWSGTFRTGSGRHPTTIAAVEAFLTVIGVVAGWLLSQLTLSLQSLRDQRGRWGADKRQLYARLLAAADACYRTTDLIANWTVEVRQATGTARSTGTRGRSSNVTALADTVTELESQLRSSRQLFAEVRLIASEDVIAAAERLHRVSEEAFLVVKFVNGEATLRNRWVPLEVAWREAREDFERIARGDLGTSAVGTARRWFPWVER